MTGRTPAFDDIVGRDDPERARLEATHDLLVAAGPPPELAPSLAAPPPEPKPGIINLPRRRYTAVAAVAIAATMLFAAGYAVGGRDRPPSDVRTITMTGPGGATASLQVQPRDAAGNWPMVLEAQGLPPLPREQTYTLWLTKNGVLADPCGTFVAGREPVEVPLNAPYVLRSYDGWVVVPTGAQAPVVLRTEKV